MYTLLNLPDHLYKYYRYDNVLNAKRFNGDVFLATPLDFNDPCDCQRKVINNTVDRIETKGKDWAFKKMLELGYSIEESAVISRSLLKEDTYKKVVYYKQLEKLGVLCLTKNENDVLMWSYYANNDGYCIEYDTEKIVHNLIIGYINALDYYTTHILFKTWEYRQDPKTRTQSLTDKQLKGASIFSVNDIPLITNVYIKEQQDKNEVVNFIKNVYHKRFAGQDIDYKVGPDGSPSNLFFDRNYSNSASKYYKKTNRWKHEDEFRIIASLGGRFVVSLGKEVVKNIYFGCNMKTEKVMELSHLAHTLGLTAGIHKMKRLVNCELQSVSLDLSKCTETFSEVDAYLNEKANSIEF